MVVDEQALHNMFKGIYCGIFAGNVFWAYCQLVVPQIELMIIVGLSLDNGTSWTGRFLRMRPMQFLGRISMALYLVHPNVIEWEGRLYLKWLFKFTASYFVKSKENVPIVNYIGIATAKLITLLISFVAATLLTFFIEEPAKKWLSKKCFKTDKKD